MGLLLISSYQRLFWGKISRFVGSLVFFLTFDYEPGLSLCSSHKSAVTCGKLFMLPHLSKFCVFLQQDFISASAVTCFHWLLAESWKSYQSQTWAGTEKLHNSFGTSNREVICFLPPHKNPIKEKDIAVGFSCLIWILAFRRTLSFPLLPTNR